MALGAAAKYPGLPLKIVPIGLNYFSGHRFRSKVYIDVADPITVQPQWVEKYKAGGAAKRESCGELLDSIYSGLRTVTATAPEPAILQLIWAVRRLYKPSGLRLTTAAKLELTRRFEESRIKLQTQPEIVQLMAKVENYNNNLKLYGLKDHQVENTRRRLKALPILIQRLFLLSFYAMAALPGLILNAPIVILARSVSERKAIQAKKDSNVKLEGKDVLATWKLLVAAALLPLCFIIYPLLAALVGYFTGWGALTVWSYFAILQLPIMYSSVRALETGRDIVNSIKPLIYDVRLNRNNVDEIRAERAELQSTIRQLVDRFGPTLFGSGFESWRLISSEQIKKIEETQPKDSKKSQESSLQSGTENTPVFEGLSAGPTVPATFSLPIVELSRELEAASESCPEEVEEKFGLVEEEEERDVLSGSEAEISLSAAKELSVSGLGRSPLSDSVSVDSA
jgi:glycerol-3-phosphate O-acyltransferase/dihydroxyacetone phosphate acyltransferase